MTAINVEFNKLTIIIIIFKSSLMIDFIKII
jgi:hypothetical protein